MSLKFIRRVIFIAVIILLQLRDSKCHYLPEVVTATLMDTTDANKTTENVHVSNETLFNCLLMHLKNGTYTIHPNGSMQRKDSDFLFNSSSYFWSGGVLSLCDPDEELIGVAKIMLLNFAAIQLIGVPLLFLVYKTNNGWKKRLFMLAALLLYACGIFKTIYPPPELVFLARVIATVYLHHAIVFVGLEEYILTVLGNYIEPDEGKTAFWSPSKKDAVLVTRFVQLVVFFCVLSVNVIILIAVLCDGPPPIPLYSVTYINACPNIILSVLLICTFIQAVKGCYTTGSDKPDTEDSESEFEIECVIV